MKISSILFAVVILTHAKAWTQATPLCLEGCLTPLPSAPRMEIVCNQPVPPYLVTLLIPVNPITKAPTGGFTLMRGGEAGIFIEPTEIASSYNDDILHIVVNQVDGGHIRKRVSLNYSWQQGRGLLIGEGAELLRSLKMSSSFSLPVECSIGNVSDEFGG